MSEYRDEISNLKRQVKIFHLIRNICIPIFIVTFIIAVSVLSYDIYQNGQDSGSLFYWIAQLFTVIAELAFDGMMVGIIFSAIWKRRIESRAERIRHGYNSENDWNNNVVHEEYAEKEEPKEESRTKDYTNPNDPFH